MTYRQVASNRQINHNRESGVLRAQLNQQTGQAEHTSNLTINGCDFSCPL